MALTEALAATATTNGTDAASTRDRLIAAAIEVFWERGYEGAGVQEIARRAGLTTGAIYGNFRGKSDLLFAAIGARGKAELDELFAARLQAEGAAELLAEMGSHLLDREGSGRVGLLLDAFVAARRDPELAALVQELVASRRAHLAGIVDLARAGGDVADEVGTDAVAAFALVLTLGSLLFTELGIPRPEGDEWSSLVTRFVAALAADDQPAPPATSRQQAPHETHDPQQPQKETR